MRSELICCFKPSPKPSYTYFLLLADMLTGHASKGYQLMPHDCDRMDACCVHNPSALMKDKLKFFI